MLPGEKKKRILPALREKWMVRNTVDENVYLQDEIKKGEKKGYLSLYQK